MNIKNKLYLCYRILKQKPGNLTSHAECELPKSHDEMQESMNRHLKEMVFVFSTYGHSGFSASYSRQMLNLLLEYKPIGPLTGGPSEWCEVGHDMWQNNRCGSVFKGVDGRAYNIDGRVFREPSGASYTTSDSRVYIEFPYTPHTEYVDVPELP